MAQPSNEDIFGTGTVRLASGAAAPSDGLFIPDSAFTAAGLADPTTATAQQHFVAILVNGNGNLTETAFNADTDRSIYYSEGFPTFVNRENGDRYQADQFVINLVKPNLATTLDPDDY